MLLCSWQICKLFAFAFDSMPQEKNKEEKREHQQNKIFKLNSLRKFTRNVIAEEIKSNWKKRISTSFHFIPSFTWYYFALFFSLFPYNFQGFHFSIQYKIQIHNVILYILDSYFLLKENTFINKMQYIATFSLLYSIYGIKKLEFNHFEKITDLRNMNHT